VGWLQLASQRLEVSVSLVTSDHGLYDVYDDEASACDTLRWGVV